MWRHYRQVIPQQRRRGRDGFMFYVQEVFNERMCNHRICSPLPVWHDGMAAACIRLAAQKKKAKSPPTAGIEGSRGGGGALFYLRHCEIGETSQQRHPDEKKKVTKPNQVPNAKLPVEVVSRRRSSASACLGATGRRWWQRLTVRKQQNHPGAGIHVSQPPAHACRYDASKKNLKKIVFDSDYVHLVHRDIGSERSKVTDKLWWNLGIFSAAGFLKASVQQQYSLMLCGVFFLQTLQACWCWLQVTHVHHMHLILHG